MRISLRIVTYAGVAAISAALAVGLMLAVISDDGADDA